MKKPIITLLALVCALILCSCATDTGDAPDGFATFNNDAVDYWFYYPSAWSADYQTGISSIQLNTSGSSVFATYARISVMAFSADTDSANDYWSDYKADISSAFGNFTEGESSTITLDDSAALVVNYTAALGAAQTTGEADDLMRYRQIICIRNGTAYIITYSASVSDFDANAADFESVIQYFTFKKDIISNIF